MKTNAKLTLEIIRTEGINQLIVRIAIAVVMWPHGAQLLLGWFGGFGFSGTMAFFTGDAGLPWLIGFLVIMIQFFGSLFILTGFLTRLNAFGMSIIVVGMMFSGHTEHGFFMNWFGQQGGEGIEFHLLLLGLSLALLFTKKYSYSMDALLKQKSKPRKYSVL